jgi:hypothetical protein
MPRRLGRFCAVSVLTAIAIVGVFAGTSSASPQPPTPAVSRASAPLLDGFALGWLPADLGPQVSDFTYTFGGIDFRSRVWERGPDADGGYHEDLDVAVLRGDRLDSAATLYRFLTNYEQRPPAQWHFVPFQVHGHPGYLGRDEAFWLVRPGIAVKVMLDQQRFSVADVALVAEGIHSAR